MIRIFSVRHSKLRPRKRGMIAGQLREHRDDKTAAQDARMNHRDTDMDTRVPNIERFKWPKPLSALSPKQQAIVDEFMQYWHHVLPRRYRAIEKFNHSYPLRHLPVGRTWRTLELGAGIGTHLEFEPLDRQEYHCIELRPDMANEIRRKYPSVATVTGDCQQQIPYSGRYFDRVIVVHVLEHLPNLPAAIAEIDRVTKPGGLFSAVLPCDPGLAYELARKLSAERLFKAKYDMPYRWLARREHINSPAEILQEIRRKFEIFDLVYFPLVVPVVNLNLCIGVTARKAAVGFPRMTPEPAARCDDFLRRHVTVRGTGAAGPPSTDASEIAVPSDLHGGDTAGRRIEGI